MNNKQWKQFYKEVIADRLEEKRCDYRKSVCDQNARIRKALDRNTVNGQIGLIINGRDCDCTQYYIERVVPAWDSVAEYKKWDEDRQDSLDGPEYITLVTPESVTPQHKSRDLALMAYEEGRSTIYPVGYDELV